MLHALKRNTWFAFIPALLLLAALVPAVLAQTPFRAPREAFNRTVLESKPLVPVQLKDKGGMGYKSSSDMNSQMMLKQGGESEHFRSNGIDAAVLPTAEALHFDGVNDYVTAPLAAAPQGTSARTIECWVKTTANTPSQTLVSYGPVVNNQRFAVLVASGNIYIAGHNNDFNTGVSANDGVWHHVAATYDGTTVRVYKDGVLVGSQAMSYATTGTNIEIGANWRGSSYGEFLNGTLDEVRIWSVARTQSQIQANMFAEIATDTGLLAAYSFNQGLPAGSNSGVTTLLDAFAAANGTLNNFALSGSTSNWVPGVPSLWTVLNNEPVGILIAGVWFTDPNNGFFVGSATTYYLTTDGGVHWSGYTFNDPKDFKSVAFANAITGVIVGSDIIINTTNGGATWEGQNYGPSYDFEDVSFGTSTVAFVVGHNEWVLRTTDGGMNWSDASPSTLSADFLGVSATDANTATAVGTSGTIRRTTNGGVTWTTQSSGTIQQLNGVSFVHSSTGTAVGNGGTILRTTNGGTTWTPQTSGTSQHLRSVRFTDANTGTAVGDGGTILRTTNGGATWINQSTVLTVALHDVFFTSATSGMAVGANLTLLQAPGLPLNIWTGAANSNWSTPANWVRGWVPSSTDNVTLPSVGVASEVTISSPITVNNLWLGTNRSITLNAGGSLTINGIVTMDGGNITLNNQNLTLGPSASVVGAGATRAIVTNGTGTVNRAIAANGSFLFPIAPTPTSYNPVTVSLGTGDPTETFSASVKGSFENLPSDTNLVLKRQWTVNEGTPGGNNATLTFQYAASDPMGPSFQPAGSTKFVGRHNGSQWVAASGTHSGSDPYTVTATGFNEFSPFAISETSTALFLAARALHFDGINDRILATLASAPQGAGARTIECWVKTSASTISQTLVNYGPVVNNQRFALLVASGKLYVSAHNNDFNTNVSVNDGVWHHVAATYDGTTVRVYKDGLLVGSQAKTFATNGTNVEIGANWRGSAYGEFLDGTLDEVRIWNVARTQAEIQMNMFLELSSGTGLIAAYHFNQGAPNANNSGVTTLIDALGGSNGTLYNFALTGTTSNWVGSGYPAGTVWTGATSNAWGTAANWSGGVVPDSTDNVTVPPTGVTNEVAITSPVTLASLSMGTGRTVTLNAGGSLTINGGLFMNGGNITLNNQNLTFGASAVVSGAAAMKAIVTNGTGSVSKSIGANTSFQFPIAPTSTSYNPVTVSLGAGNPTETFTASVKTTFDNPPNDPSMVLNRQWTINEATPGGNNVTLAFQYSSSDPMGASFVPAAPEKYIGRYTGSQWNPTSGTLSGSDPYVVTAGGFTAFSPFAISGAAGALPVQIASFTGVFVNSTVRLQWRTISEINNYGFYVQRKLQSDSVWTELPNSFIAGHGTTNEPREYSFVDESAPRTSLEYRLRQVDLDGTVHYTDPISVSGVTSVGEKEIPQKYSLSQNYPNPFNPSTTIAFGLPKASHVKLEVYNALGQKVAELVNGTLEAGYYAERFDATGLATGLYIYRLQAGDFVHVRKLVVLK